MGGHHGSRRHRRVARKSRYDEWVVDAFSSLIRGWPLDDPTGASAFREVTGSGDSASISGTYFLQRGSIGGGVSGSIATDGSTSGYSSAGDIDALDVGPSDDFTVTCWIDDFSTGSSNHGIYRKNTTGGNVRFFAHDSGGSTVVRLIVGDGTDQVVLDGSTDLSGKKSLMAGVIDRSNDEARVYLDGSQDGSADISAIGDTSNTESVDIINGRLTTYRAQHLYCFSDPLTSSELTDMHKQGVEFFDRGRLV